MANNIKTPPKDLTEAISAHYSDKDLERQQINELAKSKNPANLTEAISAHISAVVEIKGDN